MPVLKKIETKSVKLPESGITVELGLSWGEKKQIKNFWFRDVKIDASTNTAKGEIEATMIAEERVFTTKLAVKAWDATDEDGKAIQPTIENLDTLTSTDGEVLDKAINALIEDKNTEEEKKG